MAPVLTVDDEVHHRVKPSKIEAILEQYRQQEPAAAK
ncbi:MAG: hypothetical protein NT049_02420 [Planctomycetota bacterium]|nr:hypothetical protein [Planctomycetota bacterium]